MWNEYILQCLCKYKLIDAWLVPMVLIIKMFMVEVSDKHMSDKFNTFFSRCRGVYLKCGMVVRFYLFINSARSVYSPPGGTGLFPLGSPAWVGDDLWEQIELSIRNISYVIGIAMHCLYFYVHGFLFLLMYVSVYCIIQ